jgi:hypothetical protein
VRRPRNAALECYVGSRLTPGAAHVRSVDRLQLALDVYSPNNEFSRRCPDVIQFSLCICAGATPPPFAALVQLAAAVPHPVKLCNVTDGIVTLLGLDPVQV